MTAHLSNAELLDIAEGAMPEATVAHLLECTACRGELAGLRATIDDLRTSDVPEPSPLFWHHLSRRVQEAVAAEDASRWHWGDTQPRWNVAAVTMAAAAAFAVIVGVYTPPELSPEIRDERPGLAEAAPGDRLEAPFDDPTLRFVADLADTLAPEAAAGLFVMSRSGITDEVTGELSAAERLELQRLLNDALLASTSRKS